VAWLQYAFRIIYLPIGVCGVALGTVATTSTARHVAAGDIVNLRRSIRQALRMLTYLTLPATIGLIVLASPIVRLLFEHGRFVASDTKATALALVGYSLGLLAYTAVKVLAPAFYSLGSPRAPLLGSIAAVLTSIVLMMLLYDQMGFLIVAIATSVGAYANIAVLAWRFERRVGGLFERESFEAGGRILASVGAMAALSFLTYRGIEIWLGARGLIAYIATGLMPVIVGAATYLALTAWLRVPEAEALLGLVARGPLARLATRVRRTS
jgi:putative peptidoglycan lipid II flippase